jgi:hypothetical protein
MFKSRRWFFLGLIVLVSSTLSFLMLTRGHPWWDDFAAYVMQAKSLLAWDLADFVRRNAFTIQNSSYPPGPVAYPWGFPLLLAPVYAIFGLNPLALKLVGIAAYGLFLVAFFFLARTRLDETDSLLLTGVFAVTPALLAANDLILSDLPFLACSTLGLLLADRYARSPRPGLGLVLGLTAFWSFFLRTTGLLLLAPLMIASLIQAWPDWKTALKNSLVPLLTCAVWLMLQFLLLPGGQDSYLSHFSMLTPARLLDNVLYYLWLPSWTFDKIPGGMFLYPLLILFLPFSLFSHFRRDAAFHAYSLLTLLVYIVWPERQGLRFIYPLLPLLFILALAGMRDAIARLKAEWQTHAARVVSGFWSLLLVLGLGFSSYAAYDNLSHGREINGPFDNYSNQMFAFIREETPAESVIVFMRPRAMRLFTNRDAFMTENCPDLSKGDYLVLHEKMGGNGQIPPEEVEACQVPLESVFNNKRFTIYKIQK